ncbi:hypothetical protein [Clostridium sp. BL-8]
MFIIVKNVTFYIKTEHFKKWIKVVEQWFSSPRDRVTYIPVSK